MKDFIDLTVDSDEDNARPPPKKRKKTTSDSFNFIQWVEGKDVEGPNGLGIRRMPDGSATITMPDGGSWIDFFKFDKVTADDILREFDDDKHYTAVGRPKSFGNPTPRDQAFYYQGSKVLGEYGFSGRTFQGSNRLPPSLQMFWGDMERGYGDLHFGVVNRYKGSRDSISAHADDETEIVSGSAIPSLSLGATRMFVVEPNDAYKGKIILPNKGKLNIYLRHGDVLVMGGNFQSVYKHSVPKEKSDDVGKRINVTLRKFKGEAEKKK
jgi:alkylated DNA repair dioxygenase AlkB